MRRSIAGLLSVALFLALTATGQTQKTVDVIYLKSGAVVKGTILETVPKKSVRIKTMEGSVKSYRMSAVKKVVKETITVQDKTQPAEGTANANQVQEKSVVLATPAQSTPQDVLRQPVSVVGEAKSPTLALVLSAVAPGAGQLYNGEYWVKGLLQTALCGAGVAVALTMGTEYVYSSNPYTDTGYYGTYTYYRSSGEDEVTTWLYVGIGVAGAAWLWSVIDAPLSASSINDDSRAGQYGHMLEMNGPGYVVGIDPDATEQGVGAKVVVHF